MMQLNELGDYIAGVAATLAFLWLILGYQQQGEELEQNTAALRQQAGELERQVAVLQSLTEATRATVELEVDRIRPYCIFDRGKQAEPASTVYFKIANAPGHQIRIRGQHVPEDPRPERISCVQANQEFHCRVVPKGVMSASTPDVTIYVEDSRGRPYRYGFILDYARDGTIRAERVDVTD